MAKKHKSRRHFNKDEIIAMCTQVARETRMADRTPYTAMPIICLYTMLESEGWKQTRLANLANKINEYKAKYDTGEIDKEYLENRLKEKVDFMVGYEEYTLEDVTSKTKFMRWLDEKQIAPQNRINELSTEYMLLFFNALMDCGFGKERVNRVQTAMFDVLNRYVENKLLLRDIRQKLLDAGIFVEQPVDPLTQTVGSSLTM